MTALNDYLIISNISSFFIQFFFRISSDNIKQTTAGIIKNKSAIPKPVCQSGITPALASIVPNTPTSPEVPIPPPAALQRSLKTQVERGPTIALATIGGIKILGCRIKLGIWSIDVPSP